MTRPDQGGEGDDPDLVRLEVGAVATGGCCVARHEGRVVFVRHALPGELVLARVTAPEDEARRAGARFWRADAVEVLRASPDRVPTRCPVAGPGGCGGCDWQHASLDAQRAGKADLVREHLHRLAGLEWPDLTVEPVGTPDGTPDGRDDGLAWRTRMRFAVDAAGRAGLREHRSHRVVALSGCPIAHPDVAAVGITDRRWPRTEAVEVSTGTAPPALVVVEPRPGPGRPGRPPAPPGAASLARRDPGTGQVERVRGRTWVEQRVHLAGEDVALRVGEGGFWQVHPAAAQVLLDAVLDAVDPRPGERALDLYTGVGLFAAGLGARVGPGGAVLAVEGSARAVADARRNLHRTDQVRIARGRVQRVLPGLLAGPPFGGTADVVVLDPPRAGAGREVVAAVCGARPRVVAYVACDPAALARDLAVAQGLGYRLAGLRAWDLFPMTHHVECLAVLRPGPAVGPPSPGAPPA